MFDRVSDAALFAAYWIGKRISLRRVGQDYTGTVVQVVPSEFSNRMMLVIQWDHNSAMSGTFYSTDSITEIDPDV